MKEVFYVWKKTPNMHKAITKDGYICKNFGDLQPKFLFFFLKRVQVQSIVYLKVFVIPSDRLVMHFHRIRRFARFNKVSANAKLQDIRVNIILNLVYENCRIIVKQFQAMMIGDVIDRFSRWSNKFWRNWLNSRKRRQWCVFIKILYEKIQ